MSKTIDDLIIEVDKEIEALKKSGNIFKSTEITILENKKKRLKEIKEELR